MISNLGQINTFTKGMDLDDDITVIPSSRYRYAENIKVLTNDNGTNSVIQNLDGIYKYIIGDDILTATDTIIGTCTIGDMAALITRDKDNLNKIIRITGFDSARPTVHLVLKGNLNLVGNNLSIVGNKESDKLVKIYFTDGNSEMKVVNLIDDKYANEHSYYVDESGNIKNPTVLDYIPSAQLDPFTLTSVVNGSLPAGMVWYCYQLFNEFGSATKISPISVPFHLCGSTSNQNTSKYMGSFEGDNSGKGVVMTVKLHVHDFGYCRIYRILSTTNNQLPSIQIVDEIAIDTYEHTYNNITYVDRGSSFLSEITLEEFNNLATAQFTAKTLCTKDNILFAANITDETWNCGDYDARAYRANTQGNIQLNDSTERSTTINIADCDEQLKKLDKELDCINPYNLQREYNSKDTTSDYIFGKDNKLGGYGINIEYNFITTDIYLTNKQKDHTVADADSYNDVNAEYNTPFKLYEWTGDTAHVSKWVEIENVSLGSLNDPDVGSRQHNYADPEVDALLQGYQRDEIYRFGIVFYNLKSVPSPVYWIGDIRMPHAGQVPPYEYKDDRLVAHPLGIKFKVKNIPKDAIAYEIVRCDRTEADRTIITQCAATNLYKYKIQEQGTAAGEGVIDEHSLEIRPFVIPDFSETPKATAKTVFGSSAYGSFFGKWLAMALMKTGVPSDAEVATNYLRLISPEICIQEEAAEDLFASGVYLDYYQTFTSMVKGSASSAGAGNLQVTFTDNSAIALGLANHPTGMPLRVGDGNTYYYFGTSSDAAVIEGNIETYSDTDMWPLVHTLKYYYSFYDPNILTSAGSSVAKPLSILDAEYPLMVPWNSYQDVSAYKINIGTNTYTNYAHTQFKSTDNDDNDHVDNKTRTSLGQAGPCIIAQLDNNPEIYKTLKRYNPATYNNDIKVSVNGTESPLSKEHLSVAIPYFNLKKINDAQYGGNTYGCRQNSVYISVGSYHRVAECEEEQEHISYTFGGDTYMGILDYPFTMVFQGNDIKTGKDDKIFVHAYMPFESSINLNLLMGDTFSNTKSVYMQLTPVQMGSYHIQDRPYFIYNSVYSTQQSAMIFTPEATHIGSNAHANRIFASQVKTNNEVTDSWTQFKVADYLDVDNAYGKLTNLYNFQDRLYFWQDTAVGIASTNERSIITDDNSDQLVLGSGTMLTRFDYVTKAYGTNKLNDRSILISPAKLYWFDRLKNELIGFDGQQPHTMGKELQVQSYFNDLVSTYKDDIISTYDYKYNECWFEFKGDKKTLIFNESLNVFTSFYTYTYDHTLMLPDRTVIINNNLFYNLNKGITGMDKHDVYSKIEIIINQDYPYTKVFDNVRLQGNFKDANGYFMKEDQFKAMTFQTKHQTAVMSKTSKTNILDYREDTYRFALPRAQFITERAEPLLTLAPRLRGKWLRCIYEFSESKDSTFEIPQITTTFRRSLI